MSDKIDRISVVIPTNPFTPPDLKAFHHCLCAIDVEKLMEWWPGLPHRPHPDPKKVVAIQRSLDWKRVAQIASYLLQEEIEDCGRLLDETFNRIYTPRKNDPGREWPPKIRGIVRYAKSSFPFITNVLVHVNGATYDEKAKPSGVAEIGLNSSAKDFQFSVIDGQHRINGAYFALMLKRRKQPSSKFEIPSEIFLDLDPIGKEPRRQAQIFIDVNLYQKKVDRSLVADLFPTTRGNESLDRKDRAQDIGRKLMLEVGPLVGMIQIPGIRYGTKNVITLATLVSAIERVIPAMDNCEVTNLESQTAFISQLLDCWLDASGRVKAQGASELDIQTVVYQGRVLVSVMDLVPVILNKLVKGKTPFVSDKAREKIKTWLKEAIRRAGLLEGDMFIERDKFKHLGFLGQGGINKLRNILWAGINEKGNFKRMSPERITDIADLARAKVNLDLNSYANRLRNG
jgi:DGQHR domain-containing protein